MRREPTKRVVALISGSVCVLAMAGCRPDIPLIPFIKSDRQAYGITVRADEFPTPPDHSPLANPGLLRTSPVAARPLP